MRTFLYTLPGAAVIALAFWAYSENYETQQAVRETKSLRAQIAAERERLAILRAEWAYLNRPERLRDLADLNFAELGLLPLMPRHFGAVDQIDYPVPDLGLIEMPVTIDSEGALEP